MTPGNLPPRHPSDSILDFPQLKLPKLKLPQKGFPFGLLIVGAILLLSIFTSVYTVDPEEIAVVLRFGALARTAEPGLNFKLPLGIETAYKVPVERQLKEEFGFRTVRPGVRTQYANEGYEDESLMLTGDLNIAEVEWVVQYRIVDAEKFLFRVRNVRETFRAMSETIMREVVGDRTINEVITVGRQEVASSVETRLQELCDQYETGLKVEQVVLQNVNPPDPVKPSFNEVNQAEQEKDEKIKGAQRQYNEVIPRARGEALQVVSQAEGYALDRVNRARGDVARFTPLFEEYRKAPEVTRTRIYLETMSDILPKAQRKMVIDEDIKGMLPLLDLTSSGPRRPAASGNGGGEP